MGHGEGRCDIELSGTSAVIVDGRPPQYRTVGTRIPM